MGKNRSDRLIVIARLEPGNCRCRLEGVSYPVSAGFARTRQPGSGSFTPAERGNPVSARFLLTLFDSVYLLTLTAWVGSILFFSFAIAPIIFNVLGAESGAKFVRALFPRYYLWGAISGSLALPAFVAGPLCFQEYRGIRVAIQAMAILACILIMLYGANSLGARD